MLFSFPWVKGLISFVNQVMLPNVQPVPMEHVDLVFGYFWDLWLDGETVLTFNAYVNVSLGHSLDVFQQKLEHSSTARISHRRCLQRRSKYLIHTVFFLLV